MNSPRAIAAQNCCTTSVTIRSENCAITRLRSPASQEGTSRAPAPDRTARRSPRAPRPRARLRDDRRATQPRGADDLESPSNWAGVAITARTQGSANEHALEAGTWRSREPRRAVRAGVALLLGAQGAVRPARASISFAPQSRQSHRDRRMSIGREPGPGPTRLPL